MPTKFLDLTGFNKLVSLIKSMFSDQKDYIDQQDLKSAKSDYGYIAETNLLTWAQAQTRSGSFGVQKTVTTQGVPNNTPDYFIGYLDIVSTSAKRITLSSRVTGETFVNTWYNSAWVGWNHVAGYDHIQELDQEIQEVIETRATLEYVEEVFQTIATTETLGVVMVGSNLKINETGNLSVDTETEMVSNSSKPITSGAVYKEIGNIETLLASL